ncbi:MAG: GDP-mannose 4,6-dehydratase [Anaerolineae bacterium]|nr:GDP-mannose 4,6-dehydratase [Anaerolineae bacterium]
MTRTLITGGAGFIGSHLCEALLERGDQVSIIDDLSTGRFENIAHLVDDPRFSFAIDTIANELVLDRLASQADVIVHLAAVVGVQLVVESPAETIATNVEGAAAVLRAARRYRAKTLIASTSEVYGKGLRIPFREDDDVVLGATNRSRWSYAASKMVDEFLGLAYYQQHGLPVVVARFFNTVGPRQTGRYGMVMPRFVRAALAGETLHVYGDGTQTRCFCHVADTVRAIVGLTETPQAVGQVVNIGSTEEISILDLARRVVARLDSRSQIALIPYEQAYESGFEDMARRVPDIARIGALIGWSPRHTLDDIIRDVAAAMT